MMLLLSFVVSFMGFVVLSLAMKRHFRQLMPASRLPSKVQFMVLRLLGFIGLLSAVVLAVLSQGVGLGLVYWAGLLTVAALLQALLLTYRPQWLMRLTGVVARAMGSSG